MNPYGVFTLTDLISYSASDSDVDVHTNAQ